MSQIARDREVLPLVVEHLTVGYRSHGGVVSPAVRDVSFVVEPGATLAILGESGSGKTTIASAMMDLLASNGEIVSGSVRLGDEDLSAGTPEERRRRRVGRLAMVFQDPMTALNPLHTVERQVGEQLRRFGGASRAEARAEVIRLLERVQIPEPEARLRVYPHQLSGGMRQRVMIAMALALRPAYLLADEPTTALDVSVQAEILDLLRHLQEESGMGLVIIGHDLAVLAQAATDVAVMYGGRVVERGNLREIYLAPRHPYTRGLLDALPTTAGERLKPIPGSPPDPSRLPSGCAFHPRCSVAVPVCRQVVPTLRTLSRGASGTVPHDSACHLDEEVDGA